MLLKLFYHQRQDEKIKALLAHNFWFNILDVYSVWFKYRVASHKTKLKYRGETHKHLTNESKSNDV